MLRRSVTCAYGAFFGAAQLPMIQNEPMKNFAPGSAERTSLEAKLKLLNAAPGPSTIPVVIDGERYLPGPALRREVPSDTKRTFYEYHHATPELLGKAVDSSLKAGAEWSRAPFQDRAAVILKAAHLLSTKYRDDMMASTMMGQSKNVWQAEIDCIAESADFLRFNVKYAAEIYGQQPISPTHGIWNSLEYRPLDGFVLAVSPFNFTAIGMNLATAPVLMGNPVVWKPSDTALHSAYLCYQILEEAGLPKGVINFVPAAPAAANESLVKNAALSSIAFTGSTATFNKLWKEVAGNLENYRSYPRLTGETGGKNFHLVHPSADMATVVAQTLRSAFEYQGQKCSACSRLFVPKSAWPYLRQALTTHINELVVGQPDDFASFMAAVIDETSFKKINSYIDYAKTASDCKIIAQGHSASGGWFVPPTIVEASDLNCRLLKEEIFGPVLTCFVYDDSKPGFWGDIIQKIDQGAKYALTGAVFCRDRSLIAAATDGLRQAAGNLYINDKSTGAVVGQQPFGGGRVSGTNDKPGGPSFLQRFVSQRTVKETFEPLPSISYPHQLPTKITVL